jgi:hypothetical protein
MVPVYDAWACTLSFHRMWVRWEKILCVRVCVCVQNAILLSYALESADLFYSTVTGITSNTIGTAQSNAGCPTQYTCANRVSKEECCASHHARVQWGVQHEFSSSNRMNPSPSLRKSNRQTPRS